MAKKRKTKGTLGGRRPGAGRPRVVDEDDKVIVTCLLGRAHLDKLGRIGRKLGTKGRSATVRALIEKAKA